MPRWLEAAGTSLSSPASLGARDQSCPLYGGFVGDVCGSTLPSDMRLFGILDHSDDVEVIDFFTNREAADRFVAEIELNEPGTAATLEVVEWEWETSRN